MSKIDAILRSSISYRFLCSNASVKRFPKVAQFAPFKIEGLKEGEEKRWCQCGLSQRQPWCDGSHKGTGIHSLKWIVPKQRNAYWLCGCKHSKAGPLCDGTHAKISLEVKERHDSCKDRSKHENSLKLCTSCGWTPT